MPAYPHPPQPHAPLPRQARVRVSLTHGLARALGGRRGPRELPGQLAHPRILVIRPDHLGDMLFLGPALRWLREQMPQAHITLAAGPWARPALPGLAKAYDELIEIPFPGFERQKRASLVSRWGMLGSWGRKLRKRKFDAALIARADHWWGAMLARLAGIPLRLGFDTPQTTPWLTRALPLAREHAAASNLRLAAALANAPIQPHPTQHPLSFHLTPRDLGDADKLLFDIFGVDDVHPLAIVHPGAGAAVKLWEPEKWQRVITWLVEAGMRVVVTGGPQETSLTRAVAAVPSGNVIDLGGHTSFSTLAALLHRADIVLGPDSGVLHLAVAVDANTVHLYGPADPILFGPWGDSDRHVVIMSSWDCAPCGKLDWPDPAAHACVREIPVRDVILAAQKLLGSA